ncbi:MAG: PD-(D/E)XK nuclease family protein, partial [Fimbriimonadales bacterium]|nr:PD-(D/E)XK nuclease family protein [Fimbriimonadales bacterium]
LASYPMRLFLGAPYRALVAEAQRVLGEGSRLLMPTGAARLLGETSHAAEDWHGFLRLLTGVALTTQPTPETVALLSEVCEHLLTPQSYFGKVRLSPRFHHALAQSFYRWSADGLTPDLLEQGADAVRTQYAALAELDDADLQNEWGRKTAELAQLWRAWQGALRRAGIPEPIQLWQQALHALHLAPATPPLLLAGFTELTTMDIKALRILDTQTQVALALFADPRYPDASAPAEKIRQRLHQLGVPVQEERLAHATQPPAQAVEITVLDTPNPLYEVETVVREILKLHAAGMPFDEIALLVRQPEAVVETLEVVFARYGIPLQGEVGVPLERSWRVRWVMEGLRLIAGIGSGEQWLRWLAHPAHGLSFEALQPLAEQMRRHLPAARWLELALPHAADAELHRVLRELSALRATLQANLPQTARALASRVGIREPRTAADADLSEWLHLIDAYANAWRRRTPAQAVELLERLVSGARYAHQLGNTGVRLLPMEHADLVGARVAFVLQVLEGTLPRRHPDDPFLREAERNALNHALHTEGVYLPTRADSQASEPTLWRRVLQSAQERIYLSYPRTQGGEGDALPSFYLETLKAEHGTALQIRFYSLEQIVPEESDCLHPYDRSLREPVGYTTPLPLIRRAELRQQMARIERPFSVTELETLVRCPFEHFARYILRLRPLQRELSVRHVGSLTHAALCRATRQSPTRAHAQEWIDALTRCL